MKVILQMDKERITIMIDMDNVKKLRRRQAALIKEHETNWSFSRVVNEVLRGSVAL